MHDATSTEIHRDGGLVFTPNQTRLVLFVPLSCLRGVKMHIGGVSKLVSPWVGISPVKTKWTANVLSFTIPLMPSVCTDPGSFIRSKKKGSCWERGKGVPPWLADVGSRLQGAGYQGDVPHSFVMWQRFPCARVSEGFGYIKTYWAQPSLQGGLVTAAELGPVTPAEAWWKEVLDLWFIIGHFPF